ncbi:MAG: hypothetical protein IK061_06985 [Desulfovibrio sp.]|nr:hypothetical protein [Desulfovibrio sp.]
MSGLCRKPGIALFGFHVLRRKSAAIVYGASVIGMARDGLAAKQRAHDAPAGGGRQNAKRVAFFKATR